MRGAQAIRGVSLAALLLLCGAVMNGYSFWVGFGMLVSLLALAASTEIICQKSVDEVKIGYQVNAVMKAAARERGTTRPNS